VDTDGVRRRNGFALTGVVAEMRTAFMLAFQAKLKPVKDEVALTTRLDRASKLNRKAP
jgi:hypothetical protein